MLWWAIFILPGQISHNVHKPSNLVLKPDGNVIIGHNLVADALELQSPQISENLDEWYKGTLNGVMLLVRI